MQQRTEIKEFGEFGLIDYLTKNNETVKQRIRFTKKLKPKIKQFA